ncbi:MAG: ATP-binding protein, partial [Desulfonauticus sp.]|nr:ATP-binding protein [Desulfonauticus sp.]
QYLKDWVNHLPKEILWLYGPKSTGKTTLIEYLIEKELTSNLKIFDKYWIKYINFRGKLVGSYDSFLNSFIKKETQLKDKLGVRINLGLITLNYKLYQEVQNKNIDLFDAIIEELSNINKTKILVIDEIQTLDSIYYNGEKELLKEFLNFCVRLTKETHLCHVVILSSNTIFIDRIYNDAKLKVTSRFKKIDHLEYETIKNWLLGKDLGFSLQDIDLIWDYLGGCIPLIQRVLRERVYFDSLQQYLENEAKLAESEIIDLMRRFLNKKEKDTFKQIIKIIVDKGFFETGEEDNEVLVKVIDFMAEKEVFFYDPLTRKVTGNNKLYEKGFELVIGG